MIHIVNYGLGNLGSIQNMLKKVGAESSITSSPADLKNAEKIILPGVGAFDSGMRQIRERGFEDILIQKAAVEKKPILGICLGMQLLTEGSEEGQLKGLGLIAAKTKKFTPSDTIKVPHMGWNTVKIIKSSPLVDQLPEETRFYFVHSYYVSCQNPEDVLMTTFHGHEFDAAFEKDNIMGVQFHPEKSHKFGMILLSEFAKK